MANSGGEEFHFDQVVPRRGTDSLKWNRYPEDVLPLWVADMDFPSPPPVVDALIRRVRHGIFGYGIESQQLRELVCARLLRRQGWRVDPQAVVFLPGLVCGLNVVCRLVREAGGGVLVMTPVYPPFLSAPQNQGKGLHVLELRPEVRDGNTLVYPLDLDAVHRVIRRGVRLVLFCHPHNPTGRIYRRWELEELATLCERYDVLLCSDEIHHELLLDPVEFVSPAALDEVVARRTITLMAPSKTFNIPGLGCSMAVVTDESLRRRLVAAARGIVPEVNVLAMVAAQAAYQHGDAWLSALLLYLRRNRDEAVRFIHQHWPGVRVTVPEATYLLWIDFRRLELPEPPFDFLLRRARVALNDGRTFGQGGEGFVRLNFGCPRPLLLEALGRMDEALRREGVFRS